MRFRSLARPRSQQRPIEPQNTPGGVAPRAVSFGCRDLSPARRKDILVFSMLPDLTGSALIACRHAMRATAFQFPSLTSLQSKLPRSTALRADSRNVRQRIVCWLPSKPRERNEIPFHEEPAGGATELLRRELQRAIASEDYERAARLRDEIRRIEGRSNEN